MFFKLKEKKIIKISSNKIKLFKKQKQKQVKSRFIFINSCDSWRKKQKSSKHLIRNFLSWSFNSNFSLYLLKNKSNIFNYKKLTHFLKLNVRLKVNSFNLYNKKFFIILFFKNFFFYIPINLITIKENQRNLFFNKNNNSFELFDTPVFWLNFSLFLLVKLWFFKTIKSIYNFIFIKLKYKGKNYRWHRKKKGLVLRFGHSHLIYSKKPTSVFLKKKGRMKIIFFGTNFQLIYFFLRNLIKWKPSNVYTGRGLRLSKQKLLRKSGKVSAYR